MKPREEYLISIGLDHEDMKSWRIKWSHLKTSASYAKKECNLTFEDYTKIAAESGIKSPDQIDRTLDSYCLGRIGDIGPYEIGNCRFITHRQNHKERINNGGSSKIKSMIKNNGGTNRRRFRLVSPEGKIFIDSNLSKFCSNNALNKFNMFRVCKGISDSHKGWTGEYIE